MKWHIICLVVILVLYVNPMKAAKPLATDGDPFTRTGPSPRAAHVSTTPPAHQGVSYLMLWAHWQAVVWASGARPGRVMLCRWKLAWRRVRSASRKRRRIRPRGPDPVEFPTGCAPSEIGLQ